MKTYLWEVFRKLNVNPNIEYINQCCEFCDVILGELKSEICKEMNVAVTDAVIGQEDWGWYFELQKDGVFYELNISCQETDNEKRHLFYVTIEANEFEKRLIFKRKIAAESEGGKFTGKVKRIAERRAIKVSEE